MKISILLFIPFLILTSSVRADDSKASLLPPHQNNGQNYQTSQHYREMNTKELKRWIDSANPSVMIVDARDAKSDDGKRIPSAKVIPPDATVRNISANLPDKKAMVIIYCGNAECPSSRLLADRLIVMDYQNVWIYPEGIEGWEKAGYQLEKGKPAVESALESGPKEA